MAPMSQRVLFRTPVPKHHPTLPLWGEKNQRRSRHFGSFFSGAPQFLETQRAPQKVSRMTYHVGCISGTGGTLSSIGSRDQGPTFKVHVRKRAKPARPRVNRVKKRTRFQCGLNSEKLALDTKESCVKKLRNRTAWVEPNKERPSAKARAQDRRPTAVKEGSMGPIHQGTTLKPCLEPVLHHGNHG